MFINIINKNTKLIDYNKKNDTNLCVYFIGCNEYTKIGYTNDIKRRMREIQTCNPYNIKLLYIINNVHNVSIEKHAHLHFKQYHIRGEWYKISDSQINSFLSRYLTNHS